MSDSELYIIVFKNDYSRSGEVQVKMSAVQGDVN